MTTPENSKRNLQTAAARVRASLGLSEDPKSWSYAQRVAYNRALAATVLQYPDSFTASTVETARSVSVKSYGELADTSFDWAALADETASNAVPVLSGFTNKLFVVLSLAAVAYFGVLAFRNSPRRQ